MIMDKVKWVKRAFLTVGLGTVAIVALIGLIFGKIVEATLFEEVAKWALMALVLGVIVCAVFYAPIMIAANRRAALYPEFGKKWWIEDIKRVFRKKQ